MIWPLEKSHQVYLRAKVMAEGLSRLTVFLLGWNKCRVVEVRRSSLLCPSVSGPGTGWRPAIPKAVPPTGSKVVCKATLLRSTSYSRLNSVADAVRPTAGCGLSMGRDEHIQYEGATL